MSDSFNPGDYKVALLAGGSSGERSISLASGEGAKAALLEAGYRVEQLDPSEKEDLKKLIDGDYDVAFLCLHGRKGEDGVVQGFLELIDLPYTGSGVWASALAMNKARSKAYYREAGVPTPCSQVLRRGDAVSEVLANWVSRGKCVVKPLKEGSSLGVFIVEGEEAVVEAVEKAFELDDEILIEDYIRGTELTVAVVEQGDPQALPIIEIVPQSDSYDFDSKYQPGGSQHICPARLGGDVTAEIKDFAVRAHKALGCRGVSRSDFILDESGKAWILETNTIPGMTKTSLLPDAGRAAGMSFPQLCTVLIKNALAR